MSKKKAPRLGGDGAVSDVGNTDNMNRNTSAATLSSEDGSLPITDCPIDGDIALPIMDAPRVDDAPDDDGSQDEKVKVTSMSDAALAAMANNRPRRESYAEVIRMTTEHYISTLDPDNPPTPEKLESELMDEVFRSINLRNTGALKEDRWAIPRYLTASQVAMIIAWLYKVKVIETEWEDVTEDQRLASRKVGFLDRETGLYTTSVSRLDVHVSEYLPEAGKAEKDKVMGLLHDQCTLTDDVVRPTRRPGEVKVGNGVFNVKTKTLRPLADDDVFLYGSPVDYVDAPPLPQIVMPDGEVWDPESAMLEWADNNPDKCEQLWQVVAAALRPDVRTDKCVIFYGAKGNNGKGTICQLIRNVVGSASCGRYSIADYGLDAEHRFNMVGIEKIQANIVDENDDTYIDSAARLRAAITGDPFEVLVKHEDKYVARQRGLNLQCVNDLPRFKSKGGNMLRRLHIIDFQTSYTGRERPYIKQDYIGRKDVLEYVLWRVLNIDFTGFAEGDATRRMLNVFEESNNPVLEFLYQMLPRLTWGLAPKAFLYDLYKAWIRDVNPSGRAVGSREFWRLVEEACERHGTELGWTPTGKKMRPGSLMDAEEPLVSEYMLTKWGHMVGTVMRGRPQKLAASYEGLLRIAPRTPDTDPLDDPTLLTDQNGQPYTLDDPDAEGELLRDEYDAYLAECESVDREVAAGRMQREYKRGRSLTRGWRDKGKWYVARYHPGAGGGWYAVEYEDKPDDADAPLQYGSWLSMRLTADAADDPGHHAHAVVQLALGQREEE